MYREWRADNAVMIAAKKRINLKKHYNLNPNRYKRGDGQNNKSQLAKKDSLIDVKLQSAFNLPLNQK